MNNRQFSVVNTSARTAKVVALIVLTGVAVGVPLIRSALRRPEAAIAGIQKDTSEGASPDERRIVITWPISLERDFFAWDQTLPQVPTDTVPTSQEVAQAAFAALRLQALLVSGSSTRAIINGRAYGVGDEVEGFRIVRIEQRSLIVEHRGVEVPILLSSSPESPGR